MKRKARKKQEVKETGSVWTSFSDMFTSLSIIFLVMFVVAILKLSLSSFQDNQFKTAQISEEEKKKSLEDKEEVKNNIEHIDQLRLEIENKMKNLSSISSTLKDHQKKMDELVERNLKKDALVNQAQNVILEKEIRIKELLIKNQDFKVLQDSLKKENEDRIIEKNVKISQMTKKSEELEKRLQKIPTLEKDLKDKQFLIEKLKADSSNLRESLKNITGQKELALKEKIKLGQEVAELNQALNNLRQSGSDFQNNMGKKLADLEGKLAGLKSSNEEYKAQNGSLGREIVSLRGYVGNLEKENGTLKGQVNQNGVEIGQLQGTLNDLRCQNKGLLGSNDQLKGELGRYKKLSKEYGDQYAQLKDQLLKKQIQKQVGNGRSIASEKCESVKCMLEKNISERLASYDSSLSLDKDGKLSIQMDGMFGFLNDSFELRPKVKEKLREVIKIYSEELFRDPVVRKNVESISIIGHASPRFSGTFVDPHDQNTEAFKHNFKLSILRSYEILKYLISDEIEGIAYKEHLKEKLFSSGRGYLDPITREDSVKENGCGPFDCKKSRRVEIYFTLKEKMRDIASKKK